MYLVRHFLKVILFCFSLFIYVESLEHFPPRSNLCERNNKSCTFQINEAGPSDTCQMIYYVVNSTQCMELKFQETGSKSYDLGKINLKAYHYSHRAFYQTGFNVSFSKISWNRMRFRFKQDGHGIKNTCRELLVSSSKEIDSLFYDCLWSFQDYEGKTFIFEYEASNYTSTEYKFYILKVPFDSRINPELTSIEDWEIFSYIEAIPSKIGLTTLILNWQPLPVKFNVKCYDINVLSDDVIVETARICHEPLQNEFESLTYIYSTWYGFIKFHIKPVLELENSLTFTSQTPTLQLGSKHTKPLLICIVSSAVIVPVLFYLFFLIRGYLLRKGNKSWLKTPPKILIIYTPSVSSHFNVVGSLVKYLQAYCNVEPLWDEKEIPATESKDPFYWCNEEAFTHSDYVLILSSPHKQLRCTDALYKTDQLLLNILRERFGLHQPCSKFMTLVLPYCTENDLPKECKNLRKYYFPQNLNSFLRHVHGENYLSKLFCLPVIGGKKDYNLFGGELKKALEQAQLDLKNNESEYLQKQNVFRSEYEQLMLASEIIPFNLDNCDSLRNKNILMKMAECNNGSYPGNLSDINLLGSEGKGDTTYDSDSVSVHSNEMFDLNTFNNL